MKFFVISSGSSGNCCYIEENGRAILIDCGVSLRTISVSLAEYGEDISKVKSILITHEHNDHIRGLGTAARRLGAEVFVHEKTAAYISEILGKEKGSCKLTSFSEEFETAGFGVGFLPLYHDSSFCTGYRIVGKEGVYVSLTDTGILPEGAEDFVRNADTLLLESNYDEDMLVRGSYPTALKRRISGKNGHLSNLQAAAMLAGCPNLNVGRVILGHLSENNNSAELAFDAAEKTLSAEGVTEGKDIGLEVIPHGKRRVMTNVRFR